MGRMPPPRNRSWQRNLTFGGRVPWAAGALLAVTIVLSLLVAVASQQLPVFELFALRPALVWKGQVWRLVTWPFVEPDPIGLIFGCLSIYWFGAPLAAAWGSRRFLTVYAGVAAFAALGTCLVALVDASVAGGAFLGGWAMRTALVVAWGLWFPHQIIRVFYFLIPLRGYWVAWGTVAVTVVFAAYHGWDHLVLELFAELGALAWIFRRWLLGRWASYRATRSNLRSVPRARQRGVVVDVDFRGGGVDDDDRKPN
jgi:membrane associated rhomboid family serine protease